MNSPSDTLEVQVIGYLRSARHRKFQLPPQPEKGRCEGRIELLPGHNYQEALRDLEGFTRIWLIWWFHRNQNWRPTTLPPRGRTGRKGTFATRSPYRPNPLAMSNVELLRVDGLHLYIGAHDLLADTPILDIKPYIPQFDAHPEANSGWFGEMEQNLKDKASYEVLFSPQASQTVEALTDQSLLRRITETLSQDPHPHRTRRIVAFGEDYRLSCGDWRIYFKIHSRQVQIFRIAPR